MRRRVPATTAGWAATVPRKRRGGGAVYLVRKEPGAEPQSLPRSKLRHRVVEKQCHPGITDDKKHDS